MKNNIYKGTIEIEKHIYGYEWWSNKKAFPKEIEEMLKAYSENYIKMWYYCKKTFSNDCDFDYANNGYFPGIERFNIELIGWFDGRRISW